jgi:hypothetical protein
MTIIPPHFEEKLVAHGQREQKHPKDLNRQRVVPLQKIFDTQS